MLEIAWLSTGSYNTFLLKIRNQYNPWWSMSLENFVLLLPQKKSFFFFFFCTYDCSNELKVFSFPSTFFFLRAPRSRCLNLIHGFCVYQMRSAQMPPWTILTSSSVARSNIAFIVGSMVSYLPVYAARSFLVVEFEFDLYQSRWLRRHLDCYSLAPQYGASSIRSGGPAFQPEKVEMVELMAPPIFSALFWLRRYAK